MGYLVKQQIIKQDIFIPSSDCTNLDANPFLLLNVLQTSFFVPFAASIYMINDTLLNWTQFQLSTLAANGFDNLIGCADENLPIAFGAPNPIAFALNQSNTKKGYTPRANNNVYLYTLTPGSWAFGNPNAGLQVSLFYRLQTIL